MPTSTPPKCPNCGRQTRCHCGSHTCHWRNCDNCRIIYDPAKLVGYDRQGRRIHLDQPGSSGT